MRMWSSFCAAMLIPHCLAMAEPAGDPWLLVVSAAQQDDEAVRVVLEDFQSIAAHYGLLVTAITEETENAGGNVIILGDATRNRRTARLVQAGALSLQPEIDPEGYEIRTIEHPGGRMLVVAGGSVIGDVYGLYWVMDRLRVHRRIPDINEVREPAMKVRLAAAWGRHGFGGRTKEQMRLALRHSFNWVSGPNILDLVPWNAEPEATNNAQHREETRELIAYAHALHMKYFSFSNEFTYHPSLLEETGASLSPCDPKFWDAVQEKFRKLFTALPELDGIEVCNDDISGFWERYRPFDVTRENRDCDWSYVKRFHTFVKKVHEVVVGEFDKTYFHFTWGLREHEVHCQPDVFREIFTDVIPTKNLYLIPKITRADRWWHQPYNATFNLTPHETLVLFETMNYYESGASNLFPTYSGQYFQRGLQNFLLPEDSNVRGAAGLAGTLREGWDTTSAYCYVLYRLMWNPNESAEQIARDFCAIHFGLEAAEEMAEIYLLTPSAYKYGLHIEPISYGQFNSFLHMRVGTFPADGYPAIDGGKEHLEFLRRIYLRCKPWQTETMRALEHGRAVAGEMMDRFRRVRSRIADTDTAADLENRLRMTQNLIRTNIGYVDTLFAYFDYMDAPTPEHRAALAQSHEKFAEARADFINTPGFNYQLFGVDVLLQNAAAALDDVEAAKARLARMPNRRELDALIARQQQRYREVLESHRDQAVRFARFEILVDGQDLLILSGDRFRVEHIRWDAAQVAVGEIMGALPHETVTVIPKDIESRPMHPFVLEHPAPENNYTARIYLDDLPGGHGWMIFDLYYVPIPPAALGLQVPWAE